MENNWPDNLTIQQYLEGKLDKKLMHALEEKALEDPFLADALEGYSNTPTSDHGLSILQRQLHERISHQQENKKVFDLSWQRLSIAAAAAVMFITAGVLFWMNGQLPHQKLAASRNHVEVSGAPIDTLATDGAQVAKVDHQPVVAERTLREPLHESKNYNKQEVIEGKIDNTNDGERNLNAVLARKAEATVSGEEEAKMASEVYAKSTQARALKMPVSDSMKSPLAQRSNSLAEVVIPDTSRKAYPAGGWEAYQTYLQERVAGAAGIVKQKGQVVLGFKVDHTGALKDFKVLQGLSQAADSLAIEIIKAGPAWKVSPDGKDSDLRLVLDF